MKWVMRMLDKAKKDRHGFTLIELMVVLIIIAILAVAAVPTYMYFVRRAYQSEAAASLGAIKTAQIVHIAEHNVFTDQWGAAGLGMTSADFARNKWFTASCFAITTDAVSGTSDGFVAFCDGSVVGSPVGEVIVYLTSTSDVEDCGTTVTPTGNCADGSTW